MILGCFGLNVIVSLFSTISLFAVVCRRLEMFSCISLLLFASSGVATSSLQVAQVVNFRNHGVLNYDLGNYIGGLLVVQMMC